MTKISHCLKSPVMYFGHKSNNFQNDIVRSAIDLSMETQSRGISMYPRHPPSFPAMSILRAFPQMKPSSSTTRLFQIHRVLLFFSIQRCK
ncbi:uncharacterized protein BT62DRAFT_247091 [Guyanagaster necrorhizus]|uniref:Uncharacterized protein n=1 Tax=Guyanagaster necrorhizus TaxID=856835 RepID=A0A9P8AQM6_9AGAR|nr:uncharacterized protein BT62DRAFT_247091 [Guyanagaster necrorhizus MCA 3950]KAG7444513.1 hypothetical protein BT62DRAFT_247091 [Guyanagaster necrorhizus MCA 3950]